MSQFDFFYPTGQEYKMWKIIRLKLACWIARALCVPVRVADDYWIKDSVASAKQLLPDGN